MANTERLTVLAKVRASKKAASELLNDDSIAGKDRALLERLEARLDQIEDDLILADLSERVEQLKSASIALGKVVGQMKTAAKKIQNLVDKIDDAARALKILADIAAKAAAIG